MDISKLLQSKKGYIFDMDGTIFDLEELNLTCYKDTMKKFLDVDLSNDDYKRYFTGIKTEYGFKTYLEARGIKSSISIAELVSEFRKLKKKVLITEPERHIKEIEGASDYLKHLKHNGLKVALATSTIKEFTHQILDHFDVMHLFDYVVTADDIVNSKPDPEIFLKALALIGIEKEDTVIFEDSYSGIEAAKRSGILCIGIHTPGLNDQAVTGADYVIRSYNELT